MSADSPWTSAVRRIPLASVILLALLPATAAAQARGPAPMFFDDRPALPERVEKVREAVREFPFNPDMQTAAQEELSRRVKALRGVNELAQALVLPEWVGRAPPGSGTTEPAGREEIARRFEEALGKALAGDAARQCAAATLFADITVSVAHPRGQGPGGDPFTTKVLSGQLEKVASLAKGSDAGVREAVARALGRTALDSAKVVEPLARLLGDKEVTVRQAAAEALLRQARGGYTPLGQLSPRGAR